jgi:hypothetical protein
LATDGLAAGGVTDGVFRAGLGAGFFAEGASTTINFAFTTVGVMTLSYVVLTAEALQKAERNQPV